MNYHKKANITLAAVFLFFVGAAVLEYYYPNSFGVSLIFFVSEAALVGGIADWFAVTAIFRKPLGWGYHTALISRNREKVIEAVASMVQKELLSMEMIRKKIEGIPFIETLLKYVEKEGGSNYLTEKLTFYIRSYVEKQNTKHLAHKLAEFLREYAKTWNLASKIQDINEWALDQGYVDRGIDRLTEGLWDKASEGETRQVIIRYLEGIKEEKVVNGGAIFRTMLGFIEMSDGLNLEEAAEALQIELLLTLRNLKDPKHPLRISLKDTFVDKIAELERDIEFKTQIEQWKEDVLAGALLERFLESVIKAIFEASEPSALHRALHPFINQHWVNVQENVALQKTINAFIADTLCRVIKNEHDLIGNIVRETLATYTDQDLNQFIEDKAGNDLQWIRINGSMIGGVVGLILFLFLKFIYDPILSDLMYMIQ
ncbi:DUF445 domain-containing protein [Desulfosporosinus sp. BICA1-9]|uniref:DUF445 domain-containing protein n=1 Tax=Desulfosporosinus sp. BICA1-9 TaxID=1531958 RepID=UPI00054B91E3|nr:DUF445 domain-containing protein [Desulfosporosinus sp. BICA1-9]KJS46509.1 MAG: membrane protein [Peptococcaceae bacterium BRH_c23]KJS78868.1 MAG: membrane protein [Desulfosporosinus sp. BICA1-9]HBW38878.1 DUF445 domain-containing protein [Desulfosporosinus sp.]